jgi:protein-disulfide isomerase
MARATRVTSEPEEPRMAPTSPRHPLHQGPWLTPPVAQIISALILAFAILLHGGIIKIKGVTPRTTTTTPTTTTTTTTTDAGGGEGGATSNEANIEKLAAFANENNMDGDELKTCINDQKFKSEFDKDNADALAAGINGTPGFVVGKSTNGMIEGVKISGAYPFETFKAVFDAFAANSTVDQIISSRSSDALEKASASVDDDAVLGDKNAPVTLIEFSDYECPFCQRHFKQVYPSIKKDYVDTGKVKIVFRDFVAVTAHNPNATTEALAASCAREQGGDEAYYQVHDHIFANTKSNGQGL